MIWSEEVSFSLNFGFIFAKNLLAFCVKFATVEQKTFVCHLILGAELTHPAFSQLPGLSLCRPVFMRPVCLRSLALSLLLMSCFIVFKL